MSYRLRYSEEVRHALRSLPGFYRQQVRRMLEALPENPRPPRSGPLREGIPNGCRIRLGRWRIIYQVDDDERTIYVLAIRRKTGPETYQDLGLAVPPEPES